MEFFKVILTFDSVDKILRYDNSNESSLPALKHGAICFSKMKCGNLFEICFRLNLVVKGLSIAPSLLVCLAYMPIGRKERIFLALNFLLLVFSSTYATYK